MLIAATSNMLLPPKPSMMHIQRGKTLRHLVTLTFDLGLQNLYLVTPGYQVLLFPKYDVNAMNGLGGVREHTDRHTDTQRAYQY